jgi:clumping factor A
MKTSRILTGALSALVVCTPFAARAEQTLRVQVDQRGDFTMIGNTLGWDCGAGAADPVVGTIVGGLLGPCGLLPGLTRDDTSPDVFWRSDAPAGGQATASATVDTADARSTAVRQLPTGARVSHAFLYWGARRFGTTADNAVILDRPGSAANTVQATSSYIVNTPTQPLGMANVAYQSVADVTAIVQGLGSGAYRLSGVDVIDFDNSEEDILYAGWALVVLYQLDSEPPRNLAVFDGLDPVSSAPTSSSSSVSLSGFLVPNAGFDAKLGVITYEGDDGFSGDSLSFGRAPLTPASVLSDAQNPAGNFFNGTRSRLGQPVSVAGDLPQLAGTARTMAGIDLDVVDITSRVTPGQTSADVLASTTNDVYFLGAFITSISTYRPDFVTSTKSVTDVNGGTVNVGDVLEYTIVATNTGNDDSSGTTLSDPLPPGVTFVPGSISVVDGPNAGAKTDSAGDDQATYDVASRTLNVNLGTGATAAAGGSIRVGESQTVKFRVTVDSGAPAKISNQGSIAAAGVRGAPSVSTLTDGNADGPGNPPTDIDNPDANPTDGGTGDGGLGDGGVGGDGGTGGCTKNSDCPADRPICDTATGECVGCRDDSDCAGPSFTCDIPSGICVCTGGPDVCRDTDDDRITDKDEDEAGTDPNDADSDDDGVTDGREPKWNEDSDGDGLINALDPDSDDDGLYDGTELGLDCSAKGTDLSKRHCKADADRGTTTTDPLDADTDDGGALDGSEDANLDGAVDNGERNPTLGNGADDKTGKDTDGDGLSDDTEDTIHTDPKDSDSDDDGVRDGDEDNYADDTDGDKAINALDPDSDNDGLRDGTERGSDCSDKGTNRAKCVPDADPTTTTSAVDPDTDDGGATDGSEDSNLDGKKDADERDPTKGNGADDKDVTDTDGDGLGDDTEDTIGSDPNDADSDDDGVPDGQEADPAIDSDGDGKVNVVDPDSDDDGLFDGTETGRDCTGAATDTSKGTCVADADPSSTTAPTLPDTDFGGVPDGDEDKNRDGAIDKGETDPNDRCDDGVFTCDVSPSTGGGRFSSLAGASACSVRSGAQGTGWLGWALGTLLAALVLRRRRQD